MASQQNDDQNNDQNNNQNNGTRVAFVHYQFPSFVKQDYEILSRYYSMDRIDYTNVWDTFKLIRAIIASDVSFSWFAAGHAFLAVLVSKILRKKSLVVAGGYDVACVPELGHGQFTLSWRKKVMTRFSLKHADAIMAVSDFTKGEVLARMKPRKLQTVYNGVEVDKFRLPTEKSSKEDLAITVGGISWPNLKIKGMETFVRSAALIPEAHFAVIGRELDDSGEYLRSIASPNVEFTGFLSGQDLLDWYRRAKVYVQASAYESFGMSLAEAMLCECVPVATARGAMPEVVGDTGFYVPYGDPAGLAEGIRCALGSDKGKSAARRIEELFPLKKREMELVNVIDSVVGRPNGRGRLHNTDMEQRQHSSDHTSVNKEVRQS
ncbi:MAG TPA: glycosyltransferase family 4 protein [Methanotrichaceae archaeon]|nr:glycosyltransferase family 4 protein [Methanotrichaceae archaeon]